MNAEKTSNVREMVLTYLALARKALRYWPRAMVLFIVVASAGMYWVLHKARMYKSEASAAVQDVNADQARTLEAEAAQAELRTRLDQVYGSRANLGRVVDELRLFPWLRGRTSHLKVIESFQDALTYTAAGRDAFHLEFVYQDPVMAQRTVQRLLQLYTDERRVAGQSQTRNDLASVNTALGGLETVLSDQEDRMERFERANHDMVEQVRLRRLGQLQVHGMVGGVASGVAMLAPPAPEPNEGVRAHRLRIRLNGLLGRHAALERSLSAPPAAATATAVPAEESERLQTLRHAVTDLRERLARLRTTYTDAYPDVQVTIRRLADTERDLAAAVAAERPHARPATGTTNEAQVRAQMTSIERDIADTRDALMIARREDPAPAPSAIEPSRSARAVPHPRSTSVAPVAVAPTPAGEHPLGSLVEVESAWERLATELGATRTRYQQLLTRKFELQAQLDTVNTTGADVLRVIDPPSLPAEPEPPGRTRLAAMALALALLLGVGIAALAAFLDSRVYEPADLTRWGELPILPAIPDLRERSNTDAVVAFAGPEARNAHQDSQW